MQKHPTRLEAARRLLEIVREMTRRVTEEPDPTRAGDLTELEHWASYFALVAGMLNPPIQELLYKRDCTDPEPGLIVNGLTIWPPARPNRALIKSLLDRFPTVRYAYGVRLHSPHDHHAEGTKDLLIAAIENSDDTDSGFVDRWDGLRKANHRKCILLTLGRWVRYMETELPRLTADTAAPAVATDGGAPEPTPDVRADGSDAVTATKQGGPTRKRRGRPKDTDHEQDKRIADAWGTGEYRSKSDLAAVFNLTTTEVKHACDRHRKREAKRSNR